MAQKLYTKFQASYFLFLRQRKQSGFLAVIVRFVVNIGRKLNVELNLSINKNVGR